MSSCAPTDRLMQTLRVHVPGSTDPMLELELFNVLDEFFRRTNAWQMENQITLSQTDTEYGLDTPEGAQMVRILGVTHNNVPVPSVEQAGLIQSSLGRLDPALVFPDGDASFDPAITDLSDGTFTYSIFRPGYITTSFTPDAEQVQYPLKVAFSLSVDRSCLECDCGDWNVPEWMWDMFFQDWLDGVLGRMYGMPAKPWASQTHAVYHSKRFRNKMAFRKQEALRGFVYAVPGWRYPRNSGWV